MKYQSIIVLILTASAIAYLTTRSTNDAAAQVAPEKPSQRWEIVHSEYSYSDDAKVANFHSNVTLLLDTKTGENWMLWVDDNQNFHWVPVPKKVPNIN